MLETWNDISKQFATYERELDRIIQVVGGRPHTKRLARSALDLVTQTLTLTLTHPGPNLDQVRKLISVSHFLWPIHLRLIHKTAATRASVAREDGAC